MNTEKGFHSQDSGHSVTNVTILLSLTSLSSSLTNFHLPLE